MALACLGTIPVHADESGEQTAAFAELQRFDARLLDTGHRLAVANAEYCRDTHMTAGVSLHDIAQYQDRESARAAFGFARDIAVLAVADASPAQAAKIQANDAIAGINGSDPLGTDMRADKRLVQNSYERIAGVLDLWDAALDAGPIDVTVADGTGQLRNVRIVPEKACRSRFQIVPSKNFDASADGQVITISTQMMNYVASEDELAAIVAHEFAHNMLRHLQRLEEAGHAGGLMAMFGRNARLTKQTEIEADRLSVWLMANAGYDPAGAIRFWQRYGKEHGQGIFSAPTHYRYKKRVRLFEEEIAKMATMPRGTKGYAPPLLTGAFAELE